MPPSRLTLRPTRQAPLRAAREEAPAADPRRKLAVVREAARGAYPVGDLPSMLTEIESGYVVDDVERMDDALGPGA